MTIKCLSSLFSFIFLCLLSSNALIASSNSWAIKNSLQTKHYESSWKVEEKNSNAARRLMIGSIAPHCTYNECRGCRFKCRAEQVPVDANDPMNSAYRYRCVCYN
ncbi:EPIDERMAL PATTERNING FACTOR-like protein 9 [Platanthera zijinensis]|uniref:EPIDERMAL PATTERNING FACTOR-like protein 9 n=1 Tax=Platanthera zijinensis TaxID=2320716 RepID=A0AAP0BQG9_9ASPA